MNIKDIVFYLIMEIGSISKMSFYFAMLSFKKHEIESTLVYFVQTLSHVHFENIE